MKRAGIEKKVSDHKGRLKRCEGSLQSCPRCGTTMGAVRGTKGAVCSRCGFRDDCCE